MKLSLITFFSLLMGIYNPPTNLQGTYGWHGKSDKEPFTLVQIHYTSQNAILFYFEKGLGEPSYNSGVLYGKLTLNKKTGNYEYLSVEGGDCKLEFVKSNNKVIIKTILGDCGFGGGVGADGVYPLTDPKNPAYCTTRTGKKVYFDKTPPGKFRED